jgi:MoaA/NifB/PqqE/SkfB family radical SAM enzyme
LYGVLEKLRSQVANLNLELVWNLPVPYSTFNPVDLETELIEQIEGEGRAWLYVEPDGDVLPAQGVNRVLGNILNDNWDQIWKG